MPIQQSQVVQGTNPLEAYSQVQQLALAKRKLQQENFNSMVGLVNQSISLLQNKRKLDQEDVALKQEEDRIKTAQDQIETTKWATQIQSLGSFLNSVIKSEGSPSLAAHKFGDTFKFYFDFVMRGDEKKSSAMMNDLYRGDGTLWEKMQVLMNDPEEAARIITGASEPWKNLLKEYEESQADVMSGGGSLANIIERMGAIGGGERSSIPAQATTPSQPASTNRSQVEQSSLSPLPVQGPVNPSAMIIPNVVFSQFDPSIRDRLKTPEGRRMIDAAPTVLAFEKEKNKAIKTAISDQYAKTHGGAFLPSDTDLALALGKSVDQVQGLWEPLAKLGLTTEWSPKEGPVPYPALPARQQPAPAPQPQPTPGPQEISAGNLSPRAQVGFGIEPQMTLVESGRKLIGNLGDTPPERRAAANFSKALAIAPKEGEKVSYAYARAVDEAVKPSISEWAKKGEEARIRYLTSALKIVDKAGIVPVAQLALSQTEEGRAFLENMRGPYIQAIAAVANNTTNRLMAERLNLDIGDLTLRHMDYLYRVSKGEGKGEGKEVDLLYKNLGIAANLVAPILKQMDEFTARGGTLNQYFSQNPAATGVWNNFNTLWALSLGAKPEQIEAQMKTIPLETQVKGIKVLVNFLTKLAVGFPVFGGNQTGSVTYFNPVEGGNQGGGGGMSDTGRAVNQEFTQ
jgi:hypothetical protein